MKKHSIMKPLFMRLLIIILPLCGATSQYASESKALAAGVSDGYKQQFPNYVPFVRTPTKEEIELEKRLLQKYNPSQKRCSGAITQNDGLQIASDEGDLACMIAGFKQVAWTPFPPELDALSKAKGFKMLRVQVEKDPRKPSVIYYSPQGEKNAFLLREYLLNRRKRGSSEYAGVEENDYLHGYLLGYSQENMRAYYDHLNKLERKLVFNFEEDKKKAQEWIARHSELFSSFLDFSSFVNSYKPTITNVRFAFALKKQIAGFFDDLSKILSFESIGNKQEELVRVFKKYSPLFTASAFGFINRKAYKQWQELAKEFERLIIAPYTESKLKELGAVFEGKYLHGG